MTDQQKREVLEKGINVYPSRVGDGFTARFQDSDKIFDPAGYAYQKTASTEEDAKKALIEIIMRGDVDE